MGYKLNQIIAIEAGFMRQTIYRFNNANKDNVDRNNIFQLNFAVTNVELLLKKK